MIPREGGNKFKGIVVRAPASTRRSRASNYTQALKDRGLRTPNSIKMKYDINPGFGGPLKENKLWFYASARWVKTQNYVGGMFDNKNAGIAERLDLRSGSDRPGVRQRVPAQRQPPPDVAGEPEEQVQLLRRRSGPLPVRAT